MVCTGNLCRSPMAHALLEHRLQESGCEDVEVASTGTWAYDGNPATPEAVSVLSGRGVDLSQHRSRALDPAELEDSDVVVVMTSVHLREVSAMAPDLVDRVVLMKELPEIDLRDLSLEAPREERVRSLLSAPRPQRRRSLDLDDPMGLPTSSYERALREIEAGVEVLVRVLCS